MSGKNKNINKCKNKEEIKSKLTNPLSENCTSLYTTAYPKTSDITFGSLALERLYNLESQIKESSMIKYRNLLKSYILPVIGDKHPEQLTYDFLEKYCIHLLTSAGQKSSGLSPKTVSDIMSLIRNILQFAANKGIYLPCDGKMISVKQSPKPMRILNQNEQVKLCRYLYAELTPCNVAILLCLFTGLRIGEVCALKWEDISFEEQTIYIHQTMQRIQNTSCNCPKTKIIITAPKSNCSIRHIPLTNTLLNILSDYKQTTAGYFLTNSSVRYIEPRTLQNHFKTVLKKCSIEDANFHSLRHTFATLCIEAGFDTKSLSEILGHASINITMNRYVHPSMELKKENMQKLSRLLIVR